MNREIAKQLVTVIEQGLCEKQYGIAKHWELVKKFADGANIQVETYIGWVDTEDPAFEEDCHYRVKPEDPKNRWRADFDECYWRVELFTLFPCSIYVGKDRRTEIPNHSYERGNYFETKKDAQLVADCINKIFKLIREGVPVNEIEVCKIDRTNGANKTKVKENEKF